MDDDLFNDYRRTVVSYIKRFAYGVSVSEIAEEVGQRMVIEAMLQPKTRAYLLRNIDQIHRGRLPGELRRRASHVARMLSDSREFHPCLGDVGLVEDRNSLSDQHRLEAKIIVDELAEKDPWILRARDAYASGCTTRKEVAAYLGIAERTLYNRFGDVRRRSVSHQSVS